MTLPKDDRGLAWFAVRTNPRCERRAKAGLRAKGFRTVLPLETVWSKRDKLGRKRKIERPLFVRYLFVGMEPGRKIRLATEAMWPVMIEGEVVQVKGTIDVIRGLDGPESAFFEIRRTDGIEGIVGIEGRPIAIPPTLISGLLLACVQGKFDQTKPKLKQSSRYTPGDKVRVADGPFSSFIGVVEQTNREDRIKVLVEIFGRATLVELEAGQLEAA